MDELEKVKRHLGKPIPLSLKNIDGEEDVFYFKPLNIEQQAILMELSNRIKDRPKIKVEGKEVPKLKKEDMNELFELILDICEGSMKGIDKETIVNFANNNFDQISNKLEKLIPNLDESKMELIKKKLEEGNVK